MRMETFSVRLYERLGFLHLPNTIYLPGGRSPAMWLMLREPTRASP